MKKKFPLWIPILWFVTAGIWAVALGYGIYTDITPMELRLLQGLAALSSLYAAIAGLVRHNMGKTE